MPETTNEMDFAFEEWCKSTNEVDRACVCENCKQNSWEAWKAMLDYALNNY